MEYRCFFCKKTVADSYLRKRIHCPYCGSKILHKMRNSITHVKAR